MTIDPPLPPRLERFVRKQLACGRFHSEADLLRAALHLLADQSASHQTSESQRNHDAGKESGRLSAEATEARQAEALTGNDTSHTDGRRSPRGILADLKSGLSFEEIKDARSAMWSGLPHGMAG